ncbi:Delta-like protein 4 [Frankliniella fusca]|nr:Delta-like protein 4 [Frankliniella fusca]
MVHPCRAILLLIAGGFVYGGESPVIVDFIDNDIVGVAVDATVEQKTIGTICHCVQLPLTTTLAELQALSRDTGDLLRLGLCHIANDDCRDIGETMDRADGFHVAPATVGQHCEPCETIAHLPEQPVLTTSTRLLLQGYANATDHVRHVILKALAGEWRCVGKFLDEMGLLSDTVLSRQVPSYSTLSCLAVVESLPPTASIDCNEVDNMSVIFTDGAIRLSVLAPLVETVKSFVFLPVPQPTGLETANFLGDMPTSPVAVTLSLENPPSMLGGENYECLQALFGSSGSCALKERVMDAPIVFPLDSPGKWLVIAASPQVLAIRPSQRLPLSRVKIQGRVLIRIPEGSDCCHSIRMGTQINFLSLAHFNSTQFVFLNKLNFVTTPTADLTRDNDTTSPPTSPPHLTPHLTPHLAPHLLFPPSHHERYPTPPRPILHSPKPYLAPHL